MEQNLAQMPNMVVMVECGEDSTPSLLLTSIFTVFKAHPRDF